MFFLGTSTSKKETKHCKDAKNPIENIISSCVNLCLIKSIGEQTSNKINHEKYSVTNTGIPSVFFAWFYITNQPSYKAIHQNFNKNPNHICEN